YDHQDLPFEQLVAEIQPTRAAGYSPVFQVMFSLEDEGLGSAEFVGLPVEMIEVGNGMAPFDLILSFVATPKEIKGVLEYRADLFAEATVRRMVDHLQNILTAVTVDAERPLPQIPLLSLAETQKLLYDWNANGAPLAVAAPVHDLFAQQAAQTPNAVAVMCEGESLHYDALNAQANQLAHYLHRQGVRPGSPVAVILERSVRSVVAMLAVWKVGGVYLPLDTAYPLERLAYVLTDSKAVVVLTETAVFAKLPQTQTNTICLDGLDQALIAECSSDNLDVAVSTQDAAYIIYTSGSTGQPKGVLTGHDALVDHCQQMLLAYEMTAADRVLQFSSLSFDASLEQLLLPLLCGAMLVMRGADVWDARELLRQIKTLGL
ncbi:MAG: AMP-binding protein, partial [Anaerolineales bacterium]|nr:AMP-binding protein [Anaerolineales bacterium]